MAPAASETIATSTASQPLWLRRPVRRVEPGVEPFIRHQRQHERLKEAGDHRDHDDEECGRLVPVANADQQRQRSARDAERQPPAWPVRGRARFGPSCAGGGRQAGRQGPCGGTRGSDWRRRHHRSAATETRLSSGLPAAGSPRLGLRAKRPACRRRTDTIASFPRCRAGSSSTRGPVDGTERRQASSHRRHQHGSSDPQARAEPGI